MILRDFLFLIQPHMPAVPRAIFRILPPAELSFTILRAALPWIVGSLIRSKFCINDLYFSPTSRPALLSSSFPIWVVSPMIVVMVLMLSPPQLVPLVLNKVHGRLRARRQRIFVQVASVASSVSVPVVAVLEAEVRTASAGLVKGAWTPPAAMWQRRTSVALLWGSSVSSGQRGRRVATVARVIVLVAWVMLTDIVSAKQKADRVTLKRTLTFLRVALARIKSNLDTMVWRVITAFSKMWLL